MGVACVSIGSCHPASRPLISGDVSMPTLLKSLVLLALVTSPCISQSAESAGKAEPSSVPASQAKKVAVGEQAPDFKILDPQGKEICLAELTAKGPVLVRLTCGCLGCDKELAYFQELNEAYQGKGLTSVAIFKEPDTKVAKYVQEKKLNMLYAVDSKGTSWEVFQTKTMPTNFLIDKGGKIISVAAGCDPSGLLASKLSDKVAGLVHAEKVDVKANVGSKAAAVAKPAK
jgi:peroxiredoxin